MTVNLENPFPCNAKGSQFDPAQGLDDLAVIITNYNEVTDKLQRSHESLGAEVIRLQKQLASTDAQLQRSKRLAALGEMAAGIAHEIRNPLAAIQLYADMLHDDLLTVIKKPRDECATVTLQNASKNATEIASAVRGLDAIVTDVLSFTREINPSRREIVVFNVIDRAVETLSPQIESAKVCVVQPLDAAIRIYADPDLLHQAMLNLIRNAVEAMAPHGGTVSFETRCEQHQLLLVVRDTGPGIGEQDIDRIFNPFFTTRKSGTGLGLAIVHRIIDVHGGTITVDNDCGAVFTLSLPLSSENTAQNKATMGANI